VLKRFRFFLSLSLIFFLGCTPLYQDKPPQTNPPEEAPYQKIEVRVLTQDKGYPLGGPVDLKLEIENISAETVKFNFDSSQLFDFVIYRRGWEVWRWSYDKTFEKTPLELHIYPGEVWSFQTEWDAKDNQRRYVLGGRYYIEGILKTSTPLKSEKVEIGLTD
jgi:hypothetical protein